MYGISSRRWLPVAITILAFGSSVHGTMPLPYPTQAPDQHDNNKAVAPVSRDKINARDRATTEKIRKAIRDDSKLSHYARNIKIITQDGKVTLLGPVRSEDEMMNLQAKAVEVAGLGNVANELVPER